MEGNPFKARTLSALVFCLGAGQAASAQDDLRLQALKLLNENRISYDEFRKLVTKSDDDSGGISGDFVSDGNYASFISEGNYASFVSEANYADFLSAGNYSDFVSEANYGSDANYTASLDSLPSPKVENR